MLKLAWATIVALLAVVPSAHAVGVSAAADPDGSGVLITIIGDDADEKVTIQGAATNATAADNDLAVTIDLPPENLSQSGCTDANLGGNFRRLVCRTGKDARIVAVLGSGDDTFAVNRIDRALGGGGRVIDVDGRAGLDRLTIAAGLSDPGAGVTGPVVLPVLLTGGSDADVLESASPAELQGGIGNDVLTGGAGNDSLNGSAGDDKLNGGRGSDELSGSRGGDDVEGGEGFDAHVYGGTAPVSVTLDNACDDGAEGDARGRALQQQGGPGDCQNNGVDRDRLRGVESVTGSDGPDVLVGSAADERLLGGDGNDLVDGGGGRDDLVGEEGADTLLARDGIVDSRIICGDLLAIPPTGPDGRPGRLPATPGDRAVVDADDVVSTSCAIVERGGATGPSGDAPPAAGPPGAPPPLTGFSGAREPGAGPGGGRAGLAPQLRILTRVATPDSRGRIALRLACVYQARECASTVTLTARRSVRVVTRRAGRRRVLRLRRGAVLGRARTSIPWGRSARVRVKLKPAFRRFLAAGARRGVATRLTVVARDSGQGASAKRARVATTLRVGRRAR